MSLRPPTAGTPSTFATAVGGRIPTTASESDMRAAIATAVAGDLVDLGGWKFTLTSQLTVPAGVKVINFDFTAGAHTAVELGAGAVLARGRSFRQDTGGTTGAEKSNIVISGAGARVLDVDPDGGMLASVYIVNGIDDVTIRGGVFKNTSRIQNASAVYAQGFVGGSDHDRITVEGITLDSAWAAPDGILLFDTSRARVLRNRLKGLRQLATVTLTGWTLVSGSVYRTTDRTDGNTRQIFDNGTARTEQTATPTAPGSNEWGIDSGFVYLNLGGTDPNTHTITSTIVGGYAITLYSANDVHEMDYNLVAHNEIEDVDGFGIYWQLDANSHGNRSDHNTIRNAAQTGLQSLTLPFAAFAVTRGYDFESDGDAVDGSGYEGFWFANAAVGVIVGATARGATRSGFRTQLSEWNHEACESFSNTLHGFNCATVSGDGFINLQYSGCRAISNTLNGLNADASSGGTLSVQVRGGLYRNNSGHGVAAAVCTNTIIDGVKSYNNSGFQLNQSGGSSARVSLNNYSIPAGSSGINMAGGTDIHLGRGTNAATVTKWTVAANVEVDQAALSPTPQTLATDAIFTLTPFTSPITTYHTGTLTANRAVTLATTNAFRGCRFRIVRTGAGAFTLDVGTGPLKSLATNTWAEFEYDGSAWKLVAYGAL